MLSSVGFFGGTARWKWVCFPPYQRLHWRHQRPYMGSKLSWVTIPFHSFCFYSALYGSPTERTISHKSPFMVFPLNGFVLYSTDHIRTIFENLFAVLKATYQYFFVPNFTSLYHYFIPLVFLLLFYKILTKVVTLLTLQQLLQYFKFAKMFHSHHWFQIIVLHSLCLLPFHAPAKHIASLRSPHTKY